MAGDVVEKLEEGEGFKEKHEDGHDQEEVPGEPPQNINVQEARNAAAEGVEFFGGGVGVDVAVAILADYRDGVFVESADGGFTGAGFAAQQADAGLEEAESDGASELSPRNCSMRGSSVRPKAARTRLAVQIPRNGGTAPWRAKPAPVMKSR